jgi:predicted permease
MEAELREEMAAHLAEREQQYREQGLSASEARRRARLKFGNSTGYRELARSEWHWDWLFGFFRDLRYNLRILRRNPGFTLTVILSLGIGIGASTAIFSVVYGVLLKPLPFPNSERIMLVESYSLREDRKLVGSSLHWGFIGEMRKSLTSPEAVTAPARWNTVLTSEDGWPQRFRGGYIDSEFFRVFPVEPVIGRLPDPERMDEEDRDIILLSYDSWLANYGGDPDVLGQTLRLENRVLTIIGVLPPTYQFPNWRLQDAQFLAPYDEEMTRTEYAWRMANSDALVLLRDGFSPRQLEEETLALMAALAEERPDALELQSVAVEPFSKSYAEYHRRPIYVLFGAVLLLTLLCCVNVANLLLARNLKEQSEVAVRQSLGAGMATILRQSFAQSLILGLGGTLAGLFIGWAGMRTFAATAPSSIPYIDRIQMHPTVLAFVLTLSLAVLLLSALAPALLRSMNRLTPALQKAGRGSSGKLSARARSVLLAVQVGLSLVLLCLASLLAYNLQNTLNQDLGFSQDLVFAIFHLRGKEISPEEKLQFMEEAKERLAIHPEVSDATLAQNLPFSGMYSFLSIHVRGGQVFEQSQELIRRYVDAGYFGTINVPLVADREFLPSDGNATEAVCIVSQRFAKKYLKPGEAIGQQIKITRDPTKDHWRRVVGVIPNIQDHTRFRDTFSSVYFPLRQGRHSPYVVILKTTAEPKIF